MGKGIAFVEAKKQAQREVLGIFGFSGDYANSEELSIFGTGDGDAVLLAISVLLQGERTEAEFSELLANIIDSVEEIGAWDGPEKAYLRNWSCSANLAQIRGNILEWGFSNSVPDFERYINKYCGEMSPSSSSGGVSSSLSSSSGSSISSSSSVATYTVAYNANGGTGAPGRQTKIHDEYLTLSDKKPTRTNYIFDIWNTMSNGSGSSYAPEDYYSDNADITLYAQWKATYTVTYSANGGSGAPAAQTKIHDEYLVLSDVKPTRAGYGFRNWNTMSNGSGSSYASGDYYAENARVTLYAQWASMCNGTQYDPTTQKCENNVIETKCGSSSWYLSTQFCQSNSGAGTVKDLCGTKEYTASQFCQSTGVVKDLCGTQQFASNQQCGTGNVIETSCGGGWYDPTNTNLKCDGGVIKTKCGSSSWYSSTQFCQSNSGAGTVKDLCGTQEYTASQFCQSPGVVEELCGTQEFASNQQCGPGNEIQTICGGGWYDATNTNLSCDGGVIKTKCGSSGWYDATNTNLKCEGGVIKTKCGSSGWFNPSTQFCQSSIGTGTVKDLCGTLEYTSSQFCQSPGTVKNLCGTQTYTSSQFCYNNSKVGDFCEMRTDIYNPDEYECRPSINANAIYLKTGAVDGRNSKTYLAVLIGTQTWMAENLNYNTGSNSKCYNDNQTNCNTYGRLYEWTTTACPSGWHLPNNTEWNALSSAVGTVPGTKLKAISGWNNYGNGTDTYGFSALPGGEFTSVFQGVGDAGFWWSEDYNNNLFDYSYYRDMGSAHGNLNQQYNNKNYFRSIRCVKD